MLNGQESWASIYQWGQETFPSQLGREVGVKAQAVKLIKEAVELGIACGLSGRELFEACMSNKRCSTWRDGDPTPESVPGEVADIAIVLANLAGRAGVNVTTAVDDKMRINRARRWEVSPDGIAQHTEE